MTGPSFKWSGVVYLPHILGTSCRRELAIVWSEMLLWDHSVSLQTTRSVKRYLFSGFHVEFVLSNGCNSCEKFSGVKIILKERVFRFVWFREMLELLF